MIIRLIQEEDWSSRIAFITSLVQITRVVSLKLLDLAIPVGRHQVDIGSLAEGIELQWGDIALDATHWVTGPSGRPSRAWEEQARAGAETWQQQSKRSLLP